MFGTSSRHMEFKYVSPGVDERLRTISSDLDLSEGPPIHQKRLVTFFNHFIVTMVDLLNNFSNSCSHRLFIFDRKISKIEAELRLLEIRLNSVLGGQEDDKPEPPPLLADELPAETDEGPPAEGDELPTQELAGEIDPIVLKYVKMVQVGVPALAVKQKMRAEGVDPELLPA